MISLQNQGNCILLSLYNLLERLESSHAYNNLEYFRMMANLSFGFCAFTGIKNRNFDLTGPEIE